MVVFFGLLAGSAEESLQLDSDTKSTGNFLQISTSHASPESDKGWDDRKTHQEVDHI